MTTQQPATIFGRRLREARRRKDIPQDLLGVRIGLDEGTASARISRYETGVHEPPFSIAVKIAAALSVPTAYFYCEDDGLAEIVLMWGRASKAERKRMQDLVGATRSTDGAS
ncbi:helix-turn-helix domain-containing protein [Pandoraea bronchicola]|uniref:helix-turn-helix domain-containing protein n=1 Tax=Pandoraea bronchicola TaxID=2508287 RepID=UPI001240D283|nr:helix-turn-helix transcriptional regulator [Pandoraea bronchicola]